MKPILFSTPMVLAILSGSKTQTRRIVKPQPDDDGLWNDTELPRSLDSTLKGWNGTVAKTGASKEWKPKACPGDILWVRESFGEIYDTDNSGEGQSVREYFREPVYKADNPEINFFFTGWKPSIHMPFAAARIFLKVTGVRVERVQDICGADCVSEGIDVGDGHGCFDYLTKKYGTFDTIDSFKTLWQSVNGAESWESNPWVWVYQFEPLSADAVKELKTINQIV